MLYLNTDLVVVGCGRYIIPSLLTIDYITREIDFANIFFFSDGNLTYNKDNVTYFKIKPIQSKIEYSNFILRDLYNILTNDDRVLSSHILISQWDGFPMHPNNWSKDFLKYDYIGAPWTSPYPEIHKKVGNGGFSIRSYKLLKLIHDNYNSEFKNIQIEEKYMHMKGLYVDFEDVIVSIFKRQYLESKGINFAPFQLATKFSCENYPYNGTQFGFHGINKNTNFLPKIIKQVLANSIHIINKIKDI